MQRRSEKGKIALIVVAAIAAKKILATISAKCASAWFCLFHCNRKNAFLSLSKTRLSYCDFRFATKSRFQQFPNLTIRSLLKIKEGLKTATEIELLFLMRVFFQNSLIYCRFRLKLRAVRLLRKHFIAKRCFQQLKLRCLFNANFENIKNIRFKLNNAVYCLLFIILLSYLPVFMSM